jgi:membrane-associated protease RseP (regulator of RpoE activity)
MSGPKHLWSGDWEQESRRAPEQREPLPQLPAQDLSEQPEASTGRRITRRSMIYSGLFGAVIALVAGVALALTLGNSSPRKPHASKPWTVLTNPQTGTNSGGAALQPGALSGTPAGTGPTADWEGMQIVTAPSGAVISTVRLGSPADRAGFEPGDQFLEVDDNYVNSVSDLKAVTSKIALGHPVLIQVMRGSTSVVGASVVMTQRPTIHP